MLRCPAIAQHDCAKTSAMRAPNVRLHLLVHKAHNAAQADSIQTERATRQGHCSLVPEASSSSQASWLEPFGSRLQLGDILGGESAQHCCSNHP